MFLYPGHRSGPLYSFQLAFLYEAETLEFVVRFAFIGHGLGDRRGSLFLLIIILLTFIGVGHWDAFFVVARQPPFQYSHLLFPISHHVLHLLLCPGRRSGPACWFKPSVSSALSTG